MAIEVIIALCFLIMLAGIVGSLLPAVPGPALSLVGVYLYWFTSSYREPGVILLSLLTVAGLLAVSVDWFGPALASRLGGASTKTAVISALLGLVALLFTGPAGMLAVVFLAALGIEYYRQRSWRKGGRAALATLLGALGAPLVQLVISTAIFITMAVVYFK